MKKGLMLEGGAMRGLFPAGAAFGCNCESRKAAEKQIEKLKDFLNA